MPRVNKVIDVSESQFEKAKETAVILSKDSMSQKNIIDLFYSDNLSEVENGIKTLNEFSSKSWLLSAILLFSMVYNKDLFAQSGLSWNAYSEQARSRLGMEKRDITEALSSARFFIQYYDGLVRYGWQPLGNRAKLARAELALELSHDIDATIQHLVNDSWEGFKAWYQSFKVQKTLPGSIDYARTDIEVKHNKFYIGGKEAVTVSSDIPQDDISRINNYLTQIFETLKKGYEPAIIETYDSKEASLLKRLRDKHRQSK